MPVDKLMRLLLVICLMFLRSCTAFRQVGQHLPRFGRRYSVERSLNTELIATEKDFMIEQVRRRGMSQLESSIDKIGELRAAKNNLIQKIDASRKIRNDISKEIGTLMQSGRMDAVPELKAKVELATADADRAEAEKEELDIELGKLFSVFPNLLDESVPRGTSEEDNIIVSTWGTPKIGEGYQWHDDLAKALNGFDTEAACRMSGSRFSVLLGSVAKLERAIIRYFMDVHTLQNNYTEVSVPYIVSRSSLVGTGQLPKFEEDLFKIIGHTVCNNEDAFLIPTAEVPVTNLFREQILTPAQVPVHLVSHTPSFRAEAGSSRDAKGLLRQHQFHKVELVKICTAETSQAEHEAMVRDVERLLEALELPYRRVLLCDADMGFSASKCYDIEVWLPAQQKYREISSISNCKDFQSRRMMLRLKRTHGKQAEYLHTLNGSGLAIGRTLAAILENYQQPDGSVVIPAVLRPYMDGKEKLEFNKKILI